MPSPFPGMNPYLEQSDAWEDFHQRFITHAAESLNGQVGPNYLVKIEARLYIHELSAEERRFVGRADVAVTKRTPAEGGSAPAPGVVAAPMQLWLPAVEVQRESFVEIHDRRERRVVTVIEVLSPANKTPGPDHDAYVGKRRSLLASQTHLVEIDLRRGGVRPTPPELPSCDYYALVSRYQERPRVDVWPVGLRERLPVVPIPRAAPDADVTLDLQAVLHQVYDAAGYGKYIYADTPQPPLTPNEAAWAQQLVLQAQEA
jgi:uncharacterized protein DUF4058